MSTKKVFIPSLFVLTGMLMAIGVHSITAYATNDTPLTSPSNGEVVVFDKNQTWNDHTVIDLFARNELNNQLVYPGVTGQYAFTVQNNMVSSEDCQVVIEDENVFNIPLDVRIKRDGEYILGNETEWAKSVNFDSGVYSLAGQQKSEYEIEWKWDYYISDENDVRDTALGKHARTEDEPYNIKINVYADVESSSSTPESSEPSKPTESSEPTESSNPTEISEPTQQPSEPGNPPITGDYRNVMIPVSFIGMSIIVVFCGSKRRRGDSD